MAELELPKLQAWVTAKKNHLLRNHEPDVRIQDLIDKFRPVTDRSVVFKNVAAVMSAAATSTLQLDLIGNA